MYTPEFDRSCPSLPLVAGQKNSMWSWKSVNSRRLIASPSCAWTEPSFCTAHVLEPPSRVTQPSQALPSKRTAVRSSAIGGLAPTVGAGAGVGGPAARSAAAIAASSGAWCVFMPPRYRRGPAATRSFTPARQRRLEIGQGDGVLVAAVEV